MRERFVKKKKECEGETTLTEGDPLKRCPTNGLMKNRAKERKKNDDTNDRAEGVGVREGEYVK